MSEHGIRVCSAPGSWALGHDAQYIAHLATTPSGKNHRLPQVIVTTESKDFRMSEALKSEGLKDWHPIQFTQDKAHMGCAMAVHDSVAIEAMGQHIGAQPYIGGKRIKLLPRYETWLHAGYEGHSYFLDGLHFPPKRFGSLWPRYGDNVTATLAGHRHPIALGDWNIDYRVAARRLSLRPAVGLGIIGIAYRDSHLHAWDFSSTRWGIEHHITDHPAVTASFLPTTAWARYH